VELASHPEVNSTVLPSQTPRSSAPLAAQQEQPGRNPMRLDT
jgi:hypothetical protein